MEVFDGACEYPDAVSLCQGELLMVVLIDAVGSLARDGGTSPGPVTDRDARHVRHRNTERTLT
jgi:hypothetical protein